MLTMIGEEWAATVRDMRKGEGGTQNALSVVLGLWTVKPELNR
jgi:hypothetical protein